MALVTRVTIIVLIAIILAMLLVSAYGLNLGSPY